MSRVQTDIINKIRCYFDSIRDIVEGRTICVCLSGGADSVCLLYLMKEIQREYDLTVVAAHFNHMIRGAESDRDEQFCKALCNKLNVRLYCGRDNVPAYSELYGKSIEESARECRYEFFKRMLTRNPISYCATAHNMNDDAETLIMNIIRGSGSNGASSISPLHSNILRPLLKVSRAEIEAYIDFIGAEFVNDSTNESIEYTRNYIRHVIIPAMKEINPKVVEALSRYTESCRNDRVFFEQLVEESINGDLSKTPRALRDRIIIKKFMDYTGEHISYAVLNEIDKALKRNRRTVVSIDGKYEAVILNGRINFCHKCQSENLIYEPVTLSTGNNMLFGDKVELDISEKIYVFGECEDYEEKEYIDDSIINKIVISEILSFDNIIGDIKVRNRRPGDRIRIFGVNKSIKKLFIEEKIPKEYRDIIPVIYDEKGIIYVPFIGIADRAYPENGTRKIKILKTVINNVDQERWCIAYEE